MHPQIKRPVASKVEAFELFFEAIYRVKGCSLSVTVSKTVSEYYNLLGLGNHGLHLITSV
jgi:hypothetical protein